MNEVKVWFDFISWAEGLGTGAEQEHDAPEGPAVDVEVRGEASSCLWRTPFFEASAAGDSGVGVFEHHGDVEVDYVDLDVPALSE